MRSALLAGLRGVKRHAERHPEHAAEIARQCVAITLRGGVPCGVVTMPEKPEWVGVVSVTRAERNG